jgi:hypothetical protein
MNKITARPLKMTPIVGPETSTTYHLSTVYNIPEDRRSQKQLSSATESSFIGTSEYGNSQGILYPALCDKTVINSDNVFEK